MIKSLEVIIAITILFSFIFLIFQNIPQQNITSNVKERIFDILKLKANEPAFRSLVDDGNTIEIYTSIYD